MTEFQYIDVHTHVNLAAFDDDRTEAAKRSLDAGVAFVNVGTQKDTSKKAVEMAAHFPEGVYATVGVHPVHTSKSFHDTEELGGEGKEFVSRGEAFDPDYYRELAKSPKVVAIGECGLDYYRTEPDTIERQREGFSAQIALANELQKPLMLHVRSGSEKNAYRDAYEMVKSEAKVPGNVHFFAGSIEDAMLFWDIGYSTSFTGVITFTHDYDEVIKTAPKELLHAETDAPYVAPVPHRGSRNEPVNVKAVVARMAEIRGENEESFRVQLLDNAKQLFGM